jgi:hypothetical protein
MTNHFEELCCLLRHATVRIGKDNAQATGFYVTSNIIMTCRHVVEQFGATAGTMVDVFAVSEGEKRVAAEVLEVAREDQPDLALLQVPESASTPPVTHLLQQLESGDEVYAYGFPQGTQGDSATFRFEGVSTKHGIRLAKFKQGQTDYGFSGSPILNSRTGSVCGVVTLSRDPTTDLGARAVSVEDALSLWPFLVDAQEQAHREDRRWIEHLPLTIWTARQSAASRRIHEERVAPRPFYLDSPLESIWHEFCISARWNKRVKGLVQSVLGSAEIIPRVSALLRPLRALVLEGNCEVVREKLRNVVTESVIREVSKIAGKLREELDGDHKLQFKSREELKSNSMAASTVLQGILRLHAEIEDPTFELCFLLSGSVGSGKSHFVESLLPTDPTDTRTRFSLFLDIDRCRRNGIDETLLEEICTLTESTWSSLEQFDRYMTSFCKGRLFVVVEDLHETLRIDSRFLDLLLAFIREHSELESVYWVLTLNSTSYDLVTNDAKFWLKYGFPNVSFRRVETNLDEDDTQIGPQVPYIVGGWLSLDDLNSNVNLGINIIRRALQEDDQKHVLSALAHLDEDSSRLLSSPSIAWMFLDVLPDLSTPAIGSLRYIELADTFWDKNLFQASRSTGKRVTPVLLHQVVHLISGEIICSKAGTVERGRLIDMLATETKEEPEILKLALLSLVDARLLTITFHSDLKMGKVEQIRISNNIFWQWVVARQLLAGVQADTNVDFAKLALEDWLSQPASEVIGREGVLEYLLLLVDRNADEYNSNLPKEIWSWAVRGDRVPAEAAWFGGPKASAKTQRVVAKEATTYAQALGSRGRRELFAFCYFLGEAKGVVLTRLQRLRLLQPHYPALSATGLTQYFLYLARRIILRAESPQTLKDYMICLEGCEGMGVAQELAFYSLQELERFGHFETVRTILEYLKTLSNHYRLEETKGRWKRKFFREWILFEFCTRLVSSKGLGALRLLFDEFWYAPGALGVHKPLAREMEQEANIALGHRYRTTYNLDERKTFEQEIKTLIDRNRTDERALAFHIIRHTVPVTGGSVRVSKAFRSMICELRSDTRLHFLHARFRDFFKANCPQLVKRQQSG